VRQCGQAGSSSRNSRCQQVLQVNGRHASRLAAGAGQAGPAASQKSQVDRGVVQAKFPLVVKWQVVVGAGRRAAW